MDLKQIKEAEYLGLDDLEASLSTAHSAAEAGERDFAVRLYCEMVEAGVSDVRALLQSWRAGAAGEALRGGGALVRAGCADWS